MKKYDKYKKSGIQWVGQIPEHWDYFKLRNLTSKIGSGSTPRGGASVYTDSGVKFLRSQNIYNEGLKLTDVAHINEDTHQKMSNTHVLAGDILYNITGGSIGRCCIAPDSLGEANVNQHVSIIRANELIENVFLLYCLQSIYGQNQMKVLQSGSNREGLSASAFGNFSIFVPPLSEQRDIAAYLDDKTGKIDKATEAINKQIDDLRAYRQSLISETVTKGLNPDAPMKDSGIQWIGQIPKHWDCVKLRYLVATPLLYGASESGESDKPSFPRYIRITDITENGKLRNSGAKYLNPTIAKRYMLEPGDILFARSGATVGKTFLFTESYPACFAGYLIKVSCGEKLLPSFLYNFTKSGEYQNWVNSISTQATIQNIGADKYSDLIIPLPSPDEQEAISAFLDKKTAKIDDAIKALETQRDDLALLKQSLISEAVTGKVDVRGWNSNNETRN